ncbi:sulfotransferase domain-containing protein [Erythrobacter sp. THAF29]|uniref:sulfotransferase domain-containing protein n=1 Tax=Erythrobacter sp. THAF29 TaxID=2587851 RepID=UPI0012687B48|nr:sulfotransferase domain-containing protein [Erythrobacter sp. THAF29]QFT78479.1 Sulfotransferase domain protein [Erythrobacter sp. THAF29]
MSDGTFVWLASYPKSGNTWLRLMLGKLTGASEQVDDDVFAPVAGISSNRSTFEYHTALNTFDLTDAEIDRLRPAVYRAAAAEHDDVAFMKVHDAYGRLPNGEPFFPSDCSRAVIYIVRDPLDVAVSFAHHLGVKEFETAVRKMNDPAFALAGDGREQLRQVMYDWSSHYRSWVEQKEIPVCVIRYEDMRKNTVAVLARVVDFAKLDRSKFVMSIEDAVEASRFERLQKIEQDKGFAERPVNSEKFFRSGRSGEGRERLSASLQEELISHHADVMRELGYLEGKAA